MDGLAGLTGMTGFYIFIDTLIDFFICIPVSGTSKSSAPPPRLRLVFLVRVFFIRELKEQIKYICNPVKL